MSRIVYVNGPYRPHAQAVVSVDDRAFTFGDGVYEVCEVNGGALIEETRHLDRLGRSLDADASGDLWRACAGTPLLLEEIGRAHV